MRRPASARRRAWTLADDAILRARYPHESTAGLARALRRTVHSVYARAAGLGLRKSDAYLASAEACRLRRGDHVGLASRFAPGHVPANKGVRRPGFGPGRMPETQFPKGQRSRNWMPIGSTRLIDGYVYVKVADVRNVPWTVNWLLLHVLEWERAHGPVPAGHCVSFKDGDRLHVDLSNLELLNRGDRMRRNSIHRLPAPLKQTIRVLGALTRHIRRRTREE